MKLIRLASQESKLAVIQSKIIINLINKHFPEYKTELVTMKTTGDIRQDVSLDKILLQNGRTFETLYICKTKKADRQILPENFDTVVFASPSEVEFFDTDRTDFKAVCIGKHTFEAAKKRGFDCVLSKTQTDFKAVCGHDNNIRIR